MSFATSHISAPRMSTPQPLVRSFGQYRVQVRNIGGRAFTHVQVGQKFRPILNAEISHRVEDIREGCCDRCGHVSNQLALAGGGLCQECRGDDAFVAELELSAAGMTAQPVELRGDPSLERSSHPEALRKFGENLRTRTVNQLPSRGV